MRVCYINRLGYGVLTNDRPIGGGEVLNFAEAKELAKDKRFEVHMIVEGDMFKRLEVNNVKVWVIKKVSFPRAIIDTYKIFKKINADIYIERVATREQWVYEPAICKLLGRKYVYAEVADPASLLKRRLISKTAYKIGLRLAYKLIVNSSTIQKNIRMFTKRPTSKINVSITFTQRKAERKHILWAGRIAPEKRVNLFIDLAKRFPNEKLLIATTSEINQDLPANIVVKRHVPNNEINKYYASAKMLVHTSASEGFGLVFLEAWRNKTPTVSMLNPDGVLTKYKTGLYSENFEELVKNVGLLLKNKKKWNECSENGYAYVKQNHDIKKVIEQYKQLFLR